MRLPNFFIHDTKPEMRRDSFTFIFGAFLLVPPLLSLSISELYAANVYPSYYPNISKCNAKLRELKLKFEKSESLPMPLGTGFVATEDISEGEVIADFRDALVVSERTYLSVQIGRDLHVDDPYMLAGLNHSNNPNVWIDTINRQVVALKPIKKGEILTYFYPSTEWEMFRPFEIADEPNQDLRLVRGAKDYPMHVIQGYRLSPHILELLNSHH